ncbi:MAG: hypothetical protein V1694_00890 [Candidatus Eisenbacteria bacterium]
MAKARAIVRGYLEKIDSSVFDHYRNQITDLIGSRHGVYALYHGNTLYYVGLATNLKSRIHNHMKDRHRDKWDRFSLYMIRKEDHIREVESLLIRIAAPSANRVRGKLGGSKNLLPLLKREVAAGAREEFKTLFGLPSSTGTRGTGIHGMARRGGRKILRGRRASRPLKGLFPTGKTLYAKYKGKEYKAFVHTSGRITMGDSSYLNPTSAAKAITNTSKNGWHFWKYKDDAGKLHALARVRRR